MTKHGGSVRAAGARSPGSRFGSTTTTGLQLVATGEVSGMDHAVYDYSFEPTLLVASHGTHVVYGGWLSKRPNGVHAGLYLKLVQLATGATVNTLYIDWNRYWQPYDGFGTGDYPRYDRMYAVRLDDDRFLIVFSNINRIIYGVVVTVTGGSMTAGPPVTLLDPSGINIVDLPPPSSITGDPKDTPVLFDPVAWLGVTALPGGAVSLTIKVDYYDDPVNNPYNATAYLVTSRITTFGLQVTSGTWYVAVKLDREGSDGPARPSWKLITSGTDGYSAMHAFQTQHSAGSDGTILIADWTGERPQCALMRVVHQDVNGAGRALTFSGVYTSDSWLLSITDSDLGCDGYLKIKLGTGNTRQAINNFITVLPPTGTKWYTPYGSGWFMQDAGDRAGSAYVQIRDTDGNDQVARINIPAGTLGEHARPLVFSGDTGVYDGLNLVVVGQYLAVWTTFAYSTPRFTRDYLTVYLLGVTSQTVRGVAKAALRSTDAAFDRVAPTPMA